MGVERAGGCSHTDTDIQDVKLQRNPEVRQPPQETFLARHLSGNCLPHLPSAAAPCCLAYWSVCSFEDPSVLG